MTTPTPDTPVTLPNGIVADPAIHCFRDGKPILKTDGTPKLKPGRKPGTVVAKADPAPAPESAPAQALAPEHTVHLALGTAMASIIFTSSASVRARCRASDRRVGSRSVTCTSSPSR